MNPRYRRSGAEGGEAPAHQRKRPAKQRTRQTGSRWAETRVALTIARRNSIRSLGRSVLIALLVALPIAGLTAVAVTYVSGEPTAEERIATELAAHSARLSIASAPDETLRQDPLQTWSFFTEAGLVEGPLVDLADVLPDAARILPLYPTEIVTTATDGKLHLTGTEGQSWDESFAGMYDLIEGRSPRTDREIVVTPRLLERLDKSIGESISIQWPASTTVTIVGVMADHTQWDFTGRFFARTGAFSGVTPTTASDTELRNFSFYVHGVSLQWADVRKLNKQGVTALSREVLLNPPPPSENILNPDSTALPVVLMSSMGAGFAVLEVLLLAGAAFTVTARQHQRSLATIASVGAPRRTLFLVLAAQGVVLGAVGGVLGLAAGLGGAAAFMRFTSNGSATQYYGFHIPWLILVGFALFAVFIGWLSTLLPARNASRFDVVAALRGARKPSAPRRRTPVIGVILLVVGVLLTMAGGVLLAILIELGRGLHQWDLLMPVSASMLIAGPVLSQVALMLCGALVLRVLARLADRSGLGARLAARDAARNPSRAVPALSAIMVTVFVAVFAMCMFGAADERQRQIHRHTLMLGQASVDLYGYSWPESHIWKHENPEALEAALRATLDVDEVRTIASVPHPYNFEPGATPTDERKKPDTVWQVPRIPPQNLCPTSPRSPDHTEALQDQDSPEAQAIDSDWRCQDHRIEMGGPGVSHIYVGDADDIEFLLERDLSADARLTLEGGGAVSLYPHYVDDGSFTIDFVTREQALRDQTWETIGEPIRTETIPAVIELPDYPIGFTVFIAPNTADRLGVDYVDSSIVASTVTLPTEADIEPLNSALYAIESDATGEIWFEVETGPNENAAPWVWGLLALSGLIALASSAVAIGLARFDGRQDDATLAAVGATPMLRRSVAFWQAVIVAGVGSFLGAAMGLVPALALGANPADTPFAPPWLPIGLAVVALPLVIAMGSWLFTRRPKVQTRRMSIA